MSTLFNNNIFNIVIVIFIIIVASKLYFSSDSFNLRCIISDVNGNKYCVRDRNKLELAADRLAHVNNNLNKLVTLPTSEFTAYSENKGEKLAFCLDTEKNSKGRLIDMNTLMYVALHEVSHIATKSIGHNDEFWNNFKFMITEAKEINIYNPVDYKKEPARYCGMNISDNPYYDVK